MSINFFELPVWEYRFVHLVNVTDALEPAMRH